MPSCSFLQSVAKMDVWKGIRMIIDNIKNIGCYPQLADAAPSITAFIERAEKEELSEGKYELLGEKLFAIVQRYQTRDKIEAHMESHKKYADLQYMQHGEEMIFYDTSDELEVEEEYSMEKDIVFYKPRPDKGGICLKEGMFGYYEPQDAHMPCITGAKKNTVTKIVFKILL